MMFGTSLALIAQEFQGRERGTALGIWGATTAPAVSTGPLVGGALVDALSWRWIFLVNVPIGLAALVLARAAAARVARPGRLRRRPPRRGAAVAPRSSCSSTR